MLIRIDSFLQNMAERGIILEPAVRVELLWIDISRLNKTTQFLLCSLCVFVFYLLYGYLQEYLFSIGDVKNYGWFVTLLQFFYYSVFGYIEILCRRSRRQIPLKIYYVIAALTVGTIGFSNSSLKYLNYPTQVIFKCCKLIPVMIGGILIQKKKYKFMDYLASLVMCLGLIAFCLADSKISPKFNLLGVIVISLALVCDAVIGNVQEKAMKEYGGPNHEIVFYSYFIGFFYLFVALCLDGDIFPGIAYCNEKPEIYGQALMFAGSGYLGVQVVLTLVRTCGALTAVTVTTFRKALSIILSFIFFEKPFTWHFVWAGLILSLGISLSVFAKKTPLKDNVVKVRRNKNGGTEAGVTFNFRKPIYFWSGILIIVGIYLNILGKRQINLKDTIRRIMPGRKQKSLLDIV